MGAKIKQEEILKRFKEKHGDTYSYNNFIYKNSTIKGYITCNKHGDFLQTSKNHIKGKGCPKCGLIKNTISRSSTSEEFINKATIIHGDKYDYRDLVYINARVNSIIICPIHGKFKQLPTNHLKGKGCLKCSFTSHWKCSDFIKKANGRICTFYILRCFNETEEFYKIGITMNSVKERYYGSMNMPYNYEVISEVSGDAEFIWSLEKETHLKLKDFKYNPKIEFGGSKTECFIKF
jgi:hypothetical protein